MQREIIVDVFAGGGGTSTGIELATGRSVDIAINHNIGAVKMHMANHPTTEHYCQNVHDIDPVKVCHGRSVALAWFSPDCTHFSKARGGKPVDKDIRGLPWEAVRWAGTVRPRVIIIENVEELLTWGPVIDGKPVKEQAGRTFNSFVNALKKIGYEVEYKTLKACDYGAATIRKRLFIAARCDGRPIVWPEPTHGAPDSEAVKSGKLKPYKTAAEIIDWSIPCPSIFDTTEEIYRKYGVRAVRPLADATMRRIARGLQKFVVDNQDPFIVKVNHGGDAFRGHSIKEPLQTITAKHGYGVVIPHITQNRYGLVTAFMSKFYGGGYHGKGNSPADPLNTVTSVDHHAIVTSYMTIFRNNSNGQEHTKPLNTIMTSPGHFGEVRAFLIKYYGQGNGQEIKDPMHTITAKDRLGLVTVYDNLYAIVDIGLRMLIPRELYNAHGFPPDYIIDIDIEGKPISKSDQVNKVGNSVPPPFSEVLFRANLPELCTGKRLPNGGAGLKMERSGQLKFA